MKIVTPLSDVNNYERLVEAGADEFYCGFVPYEWLTKYLNIRALNRREFLTGCNICSFDQMKILGKKVEKYKIPVKITLNSLYYVEEQYPLIVDIINKLMNEGFNTFIIADVALIAYLRIKKINCNIHLSSEVGQINSASIEFLNQFDISRYIFTRKDTINDMKKCIEYSGSKGIEFEAFILNELCPYTGAYCNTAHNDILPQMCKVRHKIGKLKIDSCMLDKILEKRKVFLNKKPTILPMESVGKSGCGLCKIGYLRNAGISHLKVVGRGKSIDRLLIDIKYTKDIIELANSIGDNKILCKKVVELYFGNECNNLCYYP